MRHRESGKAEPVSDATGTHEFEHPGGGCLFDAAGLGRVGWLADVLGSLTPEHVKCLIAQSIRGVVHRDGLGVCDGSPTCLFHGLALRGIGR